MTNSVFTIKSPLTSTDTTLAKLYRDPLLDGVANDGVRFIADFGFGYSYPGGALTGRAAPGNPANNAVVQDVSEHANGYMNINGAESITYAGGGIDFAGALTNGYTGAGGVSGNALVIPASVAADLWAAYGGNSQQYLMCTYVKLPTSGNWPTGGATDSALTFGDFGGGNDIVSFGWVAGPGITSIRKSGVSTDTALNLVGFNTADCGQVAQLAFWRNGSETGISIRTARARTTTTGVSGAVTTTDFSAQKGKVGPCNGYWGTPDSGKNFRAYRVFVENLARSGRVPLTVLEADWLRVVARGVFS